MSGSVTVAGSTPYPWPFDGRLYVSNTALLVVEPCDVAAVPGADTVSPGVDSLVAELSTTMCQLGGVVLSLRTAPHRSGPDLRVGGRKWSVPHDCHTAGLEPAPCVRRIQAHGFDGFSEGLLDRTLRDLGIRNLILCGIGLETAIHSTMRSANDRGYECLVVGDACEPVDPALVPNALSMIEMSGGIFGAVGSGASVLEALRSRVGSTPMHESALAPFLFSTHANVRGISSR